MTSNSFHCEVCQKDTRHTQLSFDDVMRELGDPGVVNRMMLKMKSFLGALASKSKRETYKCTRCRSYLLPHLGNNHHFPIDHEFQPWHVVQRNPRMLKHVREKYNPNL